ncbi:MAG: glycosyltransferase family 1 protein [Candidatus Omnitrophota bacterium]|nr:MAG: glycosyltransferase family 1 protein [Candidatus Omnitrophota bacterium]
MKVALIVKHFSLSKGGHERYAVNLSRALAERGIDVHVFANQWEHHGMESITFQKVPMIKKPSWLRVLSFAYNVQKTLAKRKNEYDITFALTFVYPQDLYRMSDGIYRHWMQIRYSNTISRWFHCLLLRKVHLVNLHLEKQIFTPGNKCRIIANSKLSRIHAIQYYGFPEEQIDVIYNGVDHQTFNPQNASFRRDTIRNNFHIPNRAPVVLYVSHNWKRKGLSTLLRALAKASDCDTPPHLLIMGRGEPKPYKKLCKKLGIAEQAHFIGPTGQVEPYYGASDLLILPTQYDSFSNVCLEAMACGLPVITTASNGASELIRDGVNGFVQQNANDEAELYQLLKQCRDQPALQAMGKAAWETAQPFTLERNMDETLRVFRRIVQEKN